MNAKLEVKIEDMYNLCKMLHKTTYLDIRLIDEEANVILDLMKHQLPKVLSQNEVDYHNVVNILKSNSYKHYYYYANDYFLEYIAVGIWRNKEFVHALVLGPFISIVPNNNLISDIISRNKMPISERKCLHEFFQSLTVVDSRYPHYLGSLVMNLCSHSFIPTKLVTTDLNQPNLSKVNESNKITRDKILIEQRYQFEKSIMHAVSKGDIEEANNVLEKKTSILDIEDRFPETPIRSLKNYSIVFCTILRIAAERGGLHPVYLHSLSEKYSILIEKTRTIPELKKNNLAMLNDYCSAVKLNSTKHYSEIVRKAIDYIHFNLSENITLHGISNSINVNPSHLSRQFKKEVHLTITEYINKNRIEEAKLLLRRGNISITEVALLTGFSNLNYFSKIFKKLTSLTPSEYIRLQAD